ncbi:MAG: hypothetical protein ACRYG8_00090, partial [Janthinobacterium lividum]
IGLAHGMKLRHAVPANQPVRWSDVECDTTAQAIAFRLEMEALFRSEKQIGLATAGQSVHA